MATKLKLKLLVETNNKKVLFAEAGKDVTDFLMSLLALPLGSVIRVLSKENMVGCLGRLYESIQNLSNTYIQAEHNMNLLLKPPMPSLPAGPNPPLIGQLCWNRRTTSLKHVYPAGTPTNAASSAEGGFVKGVATYMVMDDLAISPMSSISSITLLKMFNVKNIGDLEEKVVEVSMKEGLALLKASLQSKTALTDVFLGK